MSIKVIGAGFGRTGTLSLKQALEQLGFDKCYHMMEVNNNPPHFDLWAKAHRGEEIDWDLLFDGYQATVDWPSCNLWREQMEHFPDAKVLLSLRDPVSWYESVMNTIYPSSIAFLNHEDSDMRHFGEWAVEIIWDKLFDGKLEDRDHTIDVFNRHNETVISSVPKEKLLVFEAKDGWEPLCRFLEVPMPDNEYPRTNTTGQFKERSEKLKD